MVLVDVTYLDISGETYDLDIDVVTQKDLGKLFREDAIYIMNVITNMAKLLEEATTCRGFKKTRIHYLFSLMSRKKTLLGTFPANTYELNDGEHNVAVFYDQGSPFKSLWTVLKDALEITSGEEYYIIGKYWWVNEPHISLKVRINRPSPLLNTLPERYYNDNIIAVKHYHKVETYGSRTLVKVVRWCRGLDLSKEFLVGEIRDGVIRIEGDYGVPSPARGDREAR